MKKRKNIDPDKVYFRSGGNPPEAGAIWYRNARVAWWPAEIKPTEERIMSIFRLWNARPKSVLNPSNFWHSFTREEVRKELAEGGLL